MRTAVRKDVTSFGTFLRTLCHEFCHHLDFQKFGFNDSWHTRGFYERAAEEPWSLTAALASPAMNLAASEATESRSATILILISASLRPCLSL
jgi:hypothetical protein